MKEVRLTLPKALALANLKRAERGQKAITMNALASEIGVAAPPSPAWQEKMPRGRPHCHWI